MSDPGVINIQLEKIIRKRVTKTNIKMDLDKSISIIPVFTSKKNISEFINTCEIALADIPDVDKPLLLKIINSKLSKNALEVCKYRELNS